MKDAIKFYNEFCLQHDLSPFNPSVDVVFAMLREYGQEGYELGCMHTAKKLKDEQ